MAEPRGYAFDKASVETIRKHVSRLQHQVNNLAPRWRHAHRPTNSSARATIVYALVNEAAHVSSTDADFAVDGCVGWNGYFADTTIAAVNNTYSAFFSDDAPVLLEWNMIDEQWEVIHNGTARNLRAIINEGAGVAGGAFDVDNIVEKDGYFKPTTWTDVVKPFSRDGDEDGVVWLVVCDDGTLECIQMECPA